MPPTHEPIRAAHPGLEVRDLAPDDSIPALTQLLHRAYRPLLDMGLRYWATRQTEDDTRKRIGAGRCLVAVVDGAIVGTATYQFPANWDDSPWLSRPDVAGVAQFAVEPSLQRRGIGTALLTRIEAIARQDGASELALSTAEPATRLIHYYSARGFRFIETSDATLTQGYRSVVLSKAMDHDVPSPIDWHSASEARAWAEAAMAKRPWRREFFAAIAAESAGAGRVLELGSGPGFLAHVVLVRHSGTRYTALDVSRAMHDLARERLGELATRADFIERSLKDPAWTEGLSDFDAVVTNQAVHELRHKRHAPDLYRGVVRVLKPGGVFLMCDHFAGDGAMQNRSLYMTPDEHEAALRAGGFARVEVLEQDHGLVLFRAIRE